MGLNVESDWERPMVLSASCEVDGLRGSRGSPRVGGALAPVGTLDDAQLLASGVVGGLPPSCWEVAGRVDEDIGRSSLSPLLFQDEW